MELYSFNLELRALRSITDPETQAQKRMVLLAKLSEGHFSIDITQQAFRRLRKIAASGDELPDWEDLVEDPRLSEEVKDTLREETDSTTPIPPTKYKAMLSKLTKYKTRRDLKGLASMIAKALDSDDTEEFDEDSIRGRAAEMLSEVGRTSTNSAKFYGLGAGAKSSGLKLAKSVLESPKEILYKTGFSDYDDKNGGLPTAGVVLMAGTTSAGKSTVSMNMGIEMASLNGIRVDRITLEMTREMEIKRTMSMVSGVEFSKIKQGSLTAKEKSRIMTSMEEMNAELESAGGSYNFVAPPAGMSMDDVLHLADATGSHVSIIDYLGLLNDISTDNQAAALSEAVRKAKIHANNTGRLYILLVQLDSDTGKIRYSRGMQEHCDVALTWSYVDPEVRALHSLPITVAKARDGELFDFEVPEEFAYMSTGRRALLARNKRDRSSRDDLSRKPPESKPPSTRKPPPRQGGSRFERGNKREPPKSSSFEREVGSYV